MANISCDCGHVFSDSQLPCPYKYNLISDEAGENLTEQIIETVENENDIFPKVDYLISNLGTCVFECPSCKGLLVFWNGLGDVAKYYGCRTSKTTMLHVG